MDPLSSQITLAALIAWGLEQIKKASWFPWVTENSDKLNRTLGLLLSGLATVGISVTNNVSWATGGTVVVVLPAGTVMLLGLWHWLQSFVLQQIVYHGVVKPGLSGTTFNLKSESGPGPTVNVLNVSQPSGIPVAKP